jgi:DHA1 family inner membrane transport protein
LIITLASLALILVAFALLMPFKVPTALLIFLWGIASFALVPPLQVRVMHAAADAPNLASAMNIGAFNLGNAVGAAVGGGVIAAGFGYPAVAIAGAVASALGLIAVIVSVRRNAAPARSRGAATLAADAS